jgi:hypothetical protein
VKEYFMYPEEILPGTPDTHFALLPEVQLDGTTAQSPDQVMAVLEVTSITTFLDPAGGEGAAVGAVPVPAPVCVVSELPVIRDKVGHDMPLFKYSHLLLWSAKSSFCVW